MSFDIISSKDNLVSSQNTKKSGAVRQAFYFCENLNQHFSNENLNQQGFKTHANYVLLWLRISAVSRESNSTAVLTLMWMYVALYIEAEAPELQLKECAL